MKTRALSRGERKAQIITLLMIENDKGISSIWTMPRIARGIGLKPSTKLNQIIQELVDEKQLHIWPYEKQGRWKGYSYSLNTTNLKKKGGRIIAIKNSGHIIDQMELF